MIRNLVIIAAEAESDPVVYPPERPNTSHKARDACREQRREAEGDLAGEDLAKKIRPGCSREVRRRTFSTRIRACWPLFVHASKLAER